MRDCPHKTGLGVCLWGIFWITDRCRRGPSLLWDKPALGSGSGLYKVPKQATEASQTARQPAVSTHSLCFSSCLQVPPTLSSSQPCLPWWWRGRMRERGRWSSSLRSLLTKRGWDCGVVALRMPWRARCTWVQFSLLSVAATASKQMFGFRLWILCVCGKHGFLRWFP